MDFRNLCSKFDVDAIRAKFPPLPDVMTQIKLPKSMSKLKSRKIFRMSREDVSRSSSKRRSASIDDIAASGKLQQQNPLGPPFTIPVPPTPSDFVNHTPERISTISSLVDKKGGGVGGRGRSLGRGATMKKHHYQDQDEESFYRSAGGIDDYCPSPENVPQRHMSPPSLRMRNDRSQAALSPSRRTISESNVKMSFKEKCQKGYRDVSDFRLKHVFAKKTVVRQDTIQVTEYVRRFEEERRIEESEEEREARELEENYKFNFKTSRRKSDESFGVSTPRESPRTRLQATNPKKTLSEQSGDESGMEQTPPARRPGIAATRFARVRKDPLRMSLDEDDGIKSPPSRQKSQEEEEDLDEEEDEEKSDIELDEVEVDKPPIPLHPIESALYNKINKQKEEEEAARARQREKMQKSRSIKKRLGTFKSVSQEGSLASNSPMKKRRAPLSPQESEEKPKSPKASQGIKQNFKRLQKSIKLPNMSLSTTSLSRGAESDVETGENTESGKPAKASKTQQFAERLKRFRSVDNVDKQTDNEAEGEAAGKSPGSPLQKITHKLQDWKKSFKRKPTEPNSDEDMPSSAASPQKRERPVGTLIKRLQHIRNRKQASTDDPDDDEEGGHSYRESFKSRAKLQWEKGMAAAQHMPQLTMEKLKESKKLFRKKQGKDKDKKPKDKDSATKANESGESDLEESEAEETTKMKLKKKGKGKPDKSPTTARHYYSSDDEDEEDEEQDKAKETTKVTLEPYQQNVMVPLSRAAWTAKPILTDSGDDLDEDDDILPRVLIHQDNTEGFESTLIIAVKCPISRSPTRTPPYITELPPDYEDSAKEEGSLSPVDSPKVSSPETRADSWVPYKEKVANLSDFQTPPHSVRGEGGGERRHSKDSILSSGGSRSHHSRKHSIDSSSEDSWMKDVPRDTSNAIGLNSVYESEEPWKIQTGPKMDAEKLYKTKSIDIFEKHKQQGMELHIFEDFDDELKNTPVVKIGKEGEGKDDEKKKSRQQSWEEEESGEEMDQPDDDNSSRITKILKQPEINPEDEEEGIKKKNQENLEKEEKLEKSKFANSPESLNGQLERNVTPMTDSGAEEDNEDSSEEDEKNKVDDDEEEGENEEDEEEDEEEEDDRPPSHKPSPPPTEVKAPGTPAKEVPTPETPPPPVPQRQPSIRLSGTSNIPKQPPPPLPEKAEEREITPPPLPQSKPPLPPNRPQQVVVPPKIPERTPSMNRVSRPLVKTASLRLAYSEQVNPEDVGKVNKLISKFEPQRRPRLIPRRVYSSQESSSQDYSDDEENEEENDGETENELEKPRSRNLSLDRTPTNKPKLQKSFSIETQNEAELKMMASKTLRRAPEPPALTMATKDPQNNNNFDVMEKLQNLQINEAKLVNNNNQNNNNPLRGPPPPLPIIITTTAASKSSLQDDSPPPLTKTITSNRHNSLSQYDSNSNCSQPNSEYGSPMAYPSSLMGSSAEVTPTSNRKDAELLNTHYRSTRRSMARDDEHFYSFDSDEENSYYSISSTGSNRYVVEL
ncbi:protein PIP82 [Musca vetustissima]|uniref:protein PIP82 n=1 Tax=Musca vetustissima TaxID=27455 RepID=UPI002AB7D16A|nr:protein PIP82 [Musca vetustissima]